MSFGQPDVIWCFMCLHGTCPSEEKPSRHAETPKGVNILGVAPKIVILSTEEEVIHAFVNETGQLIHHFLEETTNSL